MGVRFGKELYGNPPTSSPRSLPARVQAPRPRASPFQAGNPPVWGGGGRALGSLGLRLGLVYPRKDPRSSRLRHTSAAAGVNGWIAKGSSKVQPTVP
jgi:hypothetical protein